ncbi:uncharacterized protein DUF2190 [Micromonospora pisi]|uniref:Uncharacterized protein DUF2190 n=1 Tax=Micromonospora pisi TaxID=589240 RepID=A0A495JX74_9ACTN|nr:capsid cement protein [Micromonospora pisi]RKR92789.1 uncharacterized protein DUF2190 [Micromonospora pisi]
MPEYEPLFKPGDEFTMVTSAAVTGGQVAIVTGSWTAGPSTATTAAGIGHFAYDAPQGAEVKIFGRGLVHEVAASGAITAGARVVPAAGGAVATSSGHVNDLGVALTTASGGFVTYMDI